MSSQQLWGPRPVDALDLVRGDGGFLYMLRTGPSEDHVEMMVKRDIVEQCRTAATEDPAQILSRSLIFARLSLV
ncbi:hypothetical protein Q5P01_019152 [Channa striata]|uniref:Uncharacterized protein n=1 Tax=Channa striata TaxID=64152 RepID=A0AA88SBA7_CHASR|nr:hypothetical protein Q5P01_019152 [Channa striata]